MTLWQINQNFYWWIIKYAAREPLISWCEYDIYSHLEAKLVVEWMNTLKEMNE